MFRCSSRNIKSPGKSQKLGKTVTQGVHNKIHDWHPSYQLLVGGWTNPFEKYDRQNGFIFPKVRGEHVKNIWVANNQLLCGFDAAGIGYTSIN